MGIRVYGPAFKVWGVLRLQILQGSPIPASVRTGPKLRLGRIPIACLVHASCARKPQLRRLFADFRKSGPYEQLQKRFLRPGLRLVLCFVLGRGIRL